MLDRLGSRGLRPWKRSLTAAVAVGAAVGAGVALARDAWVAAGILAVVGAVAGWSGRNRVAR